MYLWDIYCTFCILNGKLIVHYEWNSLQCCLQFLETKTPKLLNSLQGKSIATFLVPTNTV